MKVRTSPIPSALFLQCHAYLRNWITDHPGKELNHKGFAKAGHFEVMHDHRVRKNRDPEAPFKLSGDARKFACLSKGENDPCKACPFIRIVTLWGHDFEPLGILGYLPKGGATCRGINPTGSLHACQNLPGVHYAPRLGWAPMGHHA